jgi:hypothetical protein
VILSPFIIPCFVQLFANKKKFSRHTADSKPVKQKVNGTVILPLLVFPCFECHYAGRCYADCRGAKKIRTRANISDGKETVPGIRNCRFSDPDCFRFVRISDPFVGSEARVGRRIEAEHVGSKLK